MTARVGLLAMPTWLPGFVPEGVTPACREPDVDPELFFPIADRYSGEARDICGRCEVKARCGQWAIDTNQRFGLWGGLDPEERNKLRRARELAS
jgi:WhiB family redox-sensing transcriptional regulator